MPATLTLHPTGQVLTLPTRWPDVTLGQFVALHAPEPGDTRLVAELLLGLEAGYLGDLAADDAGYLANLLAFVADLGPVLELLPTPGLPDVGSLPYGCLLLVHAHFEQHADRPPLASLPYVLAVYRTQLRDGKVSEASIAQTLAALLAAPVTESYADGAFFLQACRNWQPGTRLTTPTTTSPTRKNTMRAARSWLRDLGLRFRSTPWPAATS